MWRSLILGAGLLVLATGCGAGDGTGTGVAPVQESQLYEANATVLEQGEGMALDAHGPELCLGAILTSDPPQCGGPPVTNWDWDTVEGEVTNRGTTYGDYHVVGAYDGETFTVTHVGPPEISSDPGDEPDFETLCEPPPDGWEVTAWSEINDAANAYVQAQPDYVHDWITYVKKPTEDVMDPGPYIWNIVFKGDAERHEDEIRKLWSGPLCVVAQDLPSASELRRIRVEVERDLEDRGVIMLGSGSGPPIDVDVVLDKDGAAQAAYDERYGPGVVLIRSALQPVGQ
jgi:hypothetical protein